MMGMTKREDDGYRGLLRNPATGRTFLANAHTVLRLDLERVESAEQKPTATVSKTEDEVVAPVEDIEDVVDEEKEVADNASEADVALGDILAQTVATTNKETLKELGASVGVKLSAAMNAETMQDRIEKQIAAIQQAGS